MEILVTTPKNHATGGVELLHQLVYELNKYDNIDAKIWYVEGAKGHHPAYNKYNNPWTNDNPKDKNTILIFPEIWANTVNYFKNNICIIYWESVDNYISRLTDKTNIKVPEVDYHMVQSHYALDFLLNKVKVDQSKIISVSDYLNDNYLNTSISPNNRRKQVLYNPTKGLEFTNKIIKQAPDVDFIKIENMAIEQVIFLMKSSMLYIDFGNHPGKDRIPREAAICGCCVITGKNGAAKFKEDIDIHDEYKFDRIDENIPNIVEKIHYILDNFDTCYKDFNYYRDIIKSEYDLFKTGVSILVKKLEKRSI